MTITADVTIPITFKAVRAKNVNNVVYVIYIVKDALFNALYFFTLFIMIE